MTDVEHLDEQTWERLACHELTPFERERALAHVTSCQACTAVHRALLALEDDARTFDPAVPAPPVAAGPAPSLAWSRWVLVAALGAAVAFAVVVRPRFAPGDRALAPAGDALRAGSGSAAIAVIAPADGSTLGSAGFSWAPVADADAYRLRVSAADGRVVWDSPLLTASAARLPVEIPLPPGTYFWQVTASRAGEPLASSPLSRFIVAQGFGPAIVPHAQP